MSIFDEISYNLILNQTNLEPNNPAKNKYVYEFSGTKQFRNAKIALSNVNVFYSWYNISSSFANNTFSYTFTDNAGTSTFAITVPDGYYSVADLNAYLQSQMIVNGHYLVNASGQYVYYLELVENATYYSIQVNAFPFPTALPVGWTNPSGVTFPAVASTPQLIINTAGFASWTGINQGTYPSPIQATAYSKLSDVTPQTTPVQNIILRCNLLNNIVSNPPDILYSFSAAGTAFGDLVVSQPYEYLYIDVADGLFSRIEMSFYDQLLRPVTLNDSSIIIQLSFKEKREPTTR